MASNPDLERLLARIGINLAVTKVSGVFRSSTCFRCPERFSASLVTIKCLIPDNMLIVDELLPGLELTTRRIFAEPGLMDLLRAIVLCARNQW
ncbi:MULTISPECIES: hypothetical protein [unclassified Microcoleus]|uniref:hypothetical protein n=1 Tax=unclassified Microcoleus TaxID=2642155 RepID=UPI002FD07882